MSPRITLEGITSFNASHPKGTDENFAFPRFNVPDLAPGILVQAIVDVFAADLECEPFQLST